MGLPSSEQAMAPAFFKALRSVLSLPFKPYVAAAAT